jgi:hypothetical protein
MSQAISKLDSETIDQIVERAGSDYHRWERQLARTGYCVKPVRLVGRTDQVDSETGEIRTLHSSDSELGGVLLIACGDRREAYCPSCAARYRGDAFQIVSTGLVGGKGVPETVADHPALFVTFTAPSFGAVHAHRGRRRSSLPCRPRRSGKCRHGMPLSCWQRHDPQDSEVGHPLCLECFDYEGQVLWNALAPELWRRTTITLKRVLAGKLGLTVREFPHHVRLSYVKVAEFQRRGALHFHAVIRLDGASSSGEIVPPPSGLEVKVLEDSVREAAVKTSAPCPGTGDELLEFTRWGDQLDVRHLGEGEGAGCLTPKAVAAYVAKYATKSTEVLWDCGSWTLLPRWEALPSHIAKLAATAETMGARKELRSLRLEDRARTVGFGGHWSTKSRAYSTTFKALRHSRRRFMLCRSDKSAVPLDAWGRPEDEVRVQTRTQWSYAGVGFRNHGEFVLAVTAAARAREKRTLAREALKTMSRSREGRG